MVPFVYHRPESLSAARDLLRESDNPRLLAGGMTLLPTMKFRLSDASDLVDLADIEALNVLEAGVSGVEVGAMCRHADVASSPTVRSHSPALARLAGGIGDPQVRNRGTLGGSIANSDPAADYPAALLGLDATVRTDRRTIHAGDFFVDLFETALEEDEIVVSVRFEKPNRAAYVKFPNPASRYAVVGVFLAQFDDGVRVAVTGAGPCAFRAAEFEAALNADFSPRAVKDIKVASAGLNEDLHASAEFRAHLVSVMTSRAVSAVLDE